MVDGGFGAVGEESGRVRRRGIMGSVSQGGRGASRRVLDGDRG